jgi:hypothetical protein
MRTRTRQATQPLQVLGRRGNLVVVFWIWVRVRARVSVGLRVRVRIRGKIRVKVILSCLEGIVVLACDLSCLAL